MLQTQPPLLATRATQASPLQALGAQLRFPMPGTTHFVGQSVSRSSGGNEAIRRNLAHELRASPVDEVERFNLERKERVLC